MSNWMSTRFRSVPWLGRTKPQGLEQRSHEVQEHPGRYDDLDNDNDNDNDNDDVAKGIV
jgi:hypothetical protein